MTFLIEINQTTPSPGALYEAACRYRGCRAVCLVHVVASGRPAEVEAGQWRLGEAARVLRLLDHTLTVEARLEIGETAAVLLRVAAETAPALIVMSAHGEGDFPRVEGVGRAARRVLEQGCRPVLLVSPAGDRLCRPRGSAARRRLGPATASAALANRTASSLQTTAASV